MDKDKIIDFLTNGNVDDFVLGLKMLILYNLHLLEWEWNEIHHRLSKRGLRAKIELYVDEEGEYLFGDSPKYVTRDGRNGRYVLWQIGGKHPELLDL